MSKLQLLAQKRKLQTELAKQETHDQQLTTKNVDPVHPSSEKPSSGLSKLMMKRKLNKENGSPTADTALNSLLAKKKAFDLKMQKDRACKEEKESHFRSTEEIHRQLETVEPRKQTEQSIDVESTEELSTILSALPVRVDFTALQSIPTHILPSIMFSSHVFEDQEMFDVSSEDTAKVKRRKTMTHIPIINTNSIQPLEPDHSLAVKINKNFQNPSPDDKRKVVDSLTDKVSHVNLDQDKTVDDTLQQPIKKKVVATKPKSKIDIQQELTKKSAKPLLSFIVIGHVDSGKSTTIGRLLYDLGIVDSRTLHKLTKDAELAGKGSFLLAWVMDQTPEERSRGVTIDIVQTQFETEDMRFSVIDSPGHRDYVPQMINGVTQADVAVVIIDSTSDLIFEVNNLISSDSSISEISKGQTFEQLTIARNMGINKLIVLVNKMDAIDWDQDRFEIIRNTLEDKLVENLNFEKENLDFIPTSGFKGDNIVNESKDCSWYEGGSLFEHLQRLNGSNHFQSSNMDDPFVLTVTDINSSLTGNEKKSDQLVIHGRVNSGILQPGETIRLWPSEETGIVDSVTTTISQVATLAKKTGNTNVTLRQNERIASIGEFVELKLRKIDLPEAICIGDVVTKVNYETVTCATKLTCELRMFGLVRPVLIGTPFVLFRGNVSYSARLSAIEWVESKNIDPEGNVIFKKSKKRKHLSSDQRSKVVIEVEKQIPIVDASNEGSEKLKRIVLRKEGMTVGAGKIISCE